MKWKIRLLTVALMLLTAGAVTADARAASAPKACGQVAFTPNSDDVAASIRATGVTCRLARDFVKDSEGRPGRRFRGLRCTSTAVSGSELPYRRYRCVSGDDVIRWRRY